MNRTQLIERVATVARRRYGQVFNGSLFDDLVDEGLIPKGERLRNDGKRPTYEFNYRSYRRALQIVCLRSKGIVGRNAIRVRLFLRDYSQPVWDMREALRREYVDATKSVSNKIRSGYADNSKSVPPKHKASLVRQAGIVDARFESARLELQDNQLIQALRNARQKPVRRATDIGIDKLQDLLGQKISFQQLPSYSLEIFSGLLMFDPELRVTEVEVSELSKLIASVEDEMFIRARRLYRLIYRSRFSGFWESLKQDQSREDRQRATDVVLNAIRDQPSFAASAMVECVRLVHGNPSLYRYLSTDQNCDKLLTEINFLHAKSNQAS
jgi:hypothetical protein